MQSHHLASQQHYLCLEVFVITTLELGNSMCILGILSSYKHVGTSKVEALDTNIVYAINSL